MAKDHLGKVHIYTGDGKGKTTAAVGLAVRAIGRGYRVAIVQFMKGQETGEMKLAQKIGGAKIVWRQFGSEEFVVGDSASAEDKQQAQDGLEFAAQVMSENKPDILVLDEINVAIHFGLLSVESVLRFLRQWRDQGTEIILTGQKGPVELIEAADLVTEMKKVKHYFDKKTEAREGIEY